jgi:branched-subunit amino acid transport protein
VTWVVIVAVGLGSFLFRVGPLLALHRVPSSGRADRVVRHAGTAAITALIAVSTRYSSTGRATVPTLVAVAAAGVLAVRGATMLRLLVLGGATFAGTVAALRLLAG